MLSIKPTSGLPSVPSTIAFVVSENSSETVKMATAARYLPRTMSKSPAFLLEAADDELITDIGAVVEMTARHLVGTPEMRESVGEWLDRATEYCADKTLGEALQIDVSKVQLPIDAMADATWPVFANVVASTQAQQWMDSLLADLLDEY